MQKFWMMLLAAVLMSGAGFMAGCNTLEGAGEDVEEAGEAVQRGVDDDGLD